MTPVSCQNYLFFLEFMNLLFFTVAREINDYAKEELQDSEKKKVW
jgi:hypothetical protein